MDKYSNIDEARRLQDYRTTFGTPEGKRVLEDLELRFLRQDSRNHVAAGNQLGVAWIDGQRTLVLGIKKLAERPVVENMPVFHNPITQGDPLHG